MSHLQTTTFQRFLMCKVSRQGFNVDSTTFTEYIDFKKNLLCNALLKEISQCRVGLLRGRRHIASPSRVLHGPRHKQ